MTLSQLSLQRRQSRKHGIVIPDDAGRRTSQLIQLDVFVLNGSVEVGEGMLANVPDVAAAGEHLGVGCVASADGAKELFLFEVHSEKN